MEQQPTPQRGASLLGPPSRWAQACAAWLGGLLAGPSGLLAWLAWQRAAQPGMEVIFHVQGGTLLILIWSGLALLVTAMLLPFNRKPLWLATLCGAVLTPALGMALMLLNNTLR